MGDTPTNLPQKLASFSGHFTPKIIARMNETRFILGRFQVTVSGILLALMFAFNPGIASEGEVIQEKTPIEISTENISQEHEMDQLVLVAYASKYGSTREVADTVAAALGELGLDVELRHMPEVRKLAGYRAVVLGAPLYMFRWHKDARRFVSRHRKALTERPVAIFALGPITPGDEQEWQSSCEQLDKQLAKYPWLTPVVVEMFGGKIDPEKIGFPYSLFMRDVPASDLRDWTAIRAWAGKLPEVLQLEAPPAGGTDAD